MKSGKAKMSLSGQKAQRLRIGWARAARFKVPIPRDEKERLNALRSYNILDTPPEETFDSVTVLAAHVCRTPIALMVLIDRDRQWFKARVGVRVRETPREFSFCAYTIMQRGLLIIPNAVRDNRFAANPYVASGPKYRFYAGAPLVTPDNRALGTLCVIDKVRRTLSAPQKKDLIALSRLVMKELELRRSLTDKQLDGEKVSAGPGYHLSITGATRRAASRFKPLRPWRPGHSDNNERTDRSRERPGA